MTIGSVKKRCQLFVALLAAIASMVFSTNALAFDVEVVLTIQRVHGCCDNLSSSEAFFKYNVAGQSGRSPMYENMTDDEWNTINETHSFTLDSNLGTAVLEIQQHDDDSGLNFGDNIIDITQGPGDSVFILLDLNRFIWSGQNGNFCVGPPNRKGGCVSGVTTGPDEDFPAVDDDGGIEWTIDFRICGVATTDSDGDALLDGWETNGLNADCNPATACAGCPPGIDLNLPAMGARPDHKDIFLEMDWFPGVAFVADQPKQSAIQALKQAFSRAPIDAGGIANPDGLGGINLHVDTGSLIDPTGSEGGRGFGTCSNGVDDDGANGIDAADPSCLVGDNLGGGSAFIVPPALPNLLTVGLPRLTTESGCPAGETCLATGADSGNCSVTGGFCAPEDGFQVVKDLNFDANRALVFRYAITAPGASKFTPSEDGRGPGTCADGIDNLRGNGQDKTDPVCQALSEDGAGAGSCFNGRDDGADGADRADSDCSAGAEDGGPPGSCFDGFDNGGGDGADGNDAECIALSEDGAPPSSCFDARDNGGDGADAADLECAAGSEDGRGFGTCYDTLDNLADGTDRNDPDCAGAREDGAAAGSCFDGVDNGTDGADANDSECANVREDGFGRFSCYDNVDNGFDGADANDKDCNFGGGWGEIGTFIDGSGRPVYVAGNDFIEYNHDPGTMMHELGHNLGLQHGGAEVRNCKPNYLTVMNYHYQAGIQQLPGSWPEGAAGWGSCGNNVDDDVDGRIDNNDRDCTLVDFNSDGRGDNIIIDYAPGRLPDGSREVPPAPLDETSLSEPANIDGVGGPDGLVVNPTRNARREDGGPAGSCADQIDNGANGADAADPACNAASEDGGPAGSCFDLVDNGGGDGADRADPQCFNATEFGGRPGSCYDLADNDADGADGLDPDCGAQMFVYVPFASGNSENTGTCADAADNDANGAVDAADFACFDPLRDEGGGKGSCLNGRDDDGDGFRDNADPQCIDPTRSEATGTCNNGTDDDGNGLTDQLDRACLGNLNASVALSGLDLNADGIPDGIDWQQDRAISAAPVSANIDTAFPNGQPEACLNATLGPAAAAPHDDWTNIQFDFRASPFFARTPAGAATAGLNLDATLPEIERTMLASRGTDMTVAPSGGGTILPIGADNSAVAQIDVTNSGPVPAFGPVTVTFGLPSGAVALGATGACEEPAPGKVVCTLGPMRPWEKRRFAIELKLAACSVGSAVTMAVENPAGLDPKPSNNQLWLRLEQGGPWPMRGMCSARTARSGYNLANNTGAIRFQVALATGLSDDVVTSPVIGSNGLVYVGTENGKLTAVHAQTGATVWQTSAGHVIDSPLIGADGTVFVTTRQEKLSAYDGGTGALKWTRKIDDIEWDGGLDRVDFSPVMSSTGDILFAADEDLVAVSTAGVTRWDHDFGLAHPTTGAAVGSDGTIYIGVHRDLVALTPAGNEVWRFRLPNLETARRCPVVGPDHKIYVATDDKFFAVNPNGTLAWSKSIPSDPHSVPAIDPSGNVWIGWGETIIGLRSTNGQTLFTINAGDEFRSGPAIDSSGLLFVGNDNDRLYAIDTTTGQVRWTRATHGSVRVPAAIGSNGRVYFGDDDGFFYAVGVR
jgi:outer membrane protein assembly factor BamB